MKGRFHPGSAEAWLFIVLSLAGLLAIATFGGTGSVTDDDRAQALNDQFACPTCDGQSVAESNASVARTIRQFIRDEIDAGAGDEEIRDDLVKSYGTGVLLNPPASGIATLVWVLPVLVIVGGSAIVASSVSRNRAGSADPTASDEALVAELRQRDTPSDG